MTEPQAERDGEGAWAKLHRRKVVQWGVAYSAAAWTLLQGLEYLIETFHWPELIRPFATLALIVGLPVALTLAWYHGERGQQRLSGIEIALLSVILLVGGGVLWFYGRHHQPASAASTPASVPVAQDARMSIAVLPFVNMSSDPEQEYFSDGVSEQVLEQLSRLPDLRVIARTSSFAFKNKDADVAEISRRLNVSHVVEGSVRKAGSRLRITAQLVRTRDSSQLWSETFDREATDVFAIQDEIANAVVRRLQVTLLGGKRLGGAPRTDLETYNLYLQGRYLYERHGRDDMEEAADLYRRAVERDPSYALAWAALGEAVWVLAAEGYRDVNTSAREAMEATGNALRLDPRLALGHSVKGDVQYTYYWDWPAADASLRTALASDPNDAGANLRSGLLALGLGQRGEAIARLERAVELSPVSPSTHMWLSYAYLITNRLEDAERETRTAIELSPAMPQAGYRLGWVLLARGQAEAALEAMQKEPAAEWRLIGLALAYHALGRRAESDAALEEVSRRYADSFAYQIAEVHAYRGETNEAIAWLERAYRQHDSGLAVFLETDPLLEGVRNDPRYIDLLRRMKLLVE